jgi:hypothetical protein
MTVKDLDFSDLEVIELTIPIFDKVFILREASGDAGTKYKNACLNAMKVTKGQVAGFNRLADVEPLLISFCLFYKNDDGTRGTLVPIDKIRAWPYKVQNALFEKAKEISGIQDENDTVESLEERLREAKEDEEESKNGQADTGDGSD